MITKMGMGTVVEVVEDMGVIRDDVIIPVENMDILTIIRIFPKSGMFTLQVSVKEMKFRNNHSLIIVPDTNVVPFLVIRNLLHFQVHSLSLG